jgi:hypothetical protein
MVTPPTILGGQPEVRMVALMPVTEGDDWCGEFKCR